MNHMPDKVKRTTVHNTKGTETLSQHVTFTPSYEGLNMTDVHILANKFKTKCWYNFSNSLLLEIKVRSSKW